MKSTAFLNVSNHILKPPENEMYRTLSPGKNDQLSDQFTVSKFYDSESTYSTPLAKQKYMESYTSTDAYAQQRLKLQKEKEQLEREIMELKFKKEREKQKSQMTYPYSRESQSAVNNNNNCRYNELPVTSPIQQPMTPSPIQTYSSSPVYVTQPPPQPLQYQSQPNYYYSIPQQQQSPQQFVNPLSPISETPPQQYIYPPQQPMQPIQQQQQQPNMYYQQPPPPSFQQQQPQQYPLYLPRHSKTADSQLLKIYSDTSPDNHDKGDDEKYNNLKLKQSYSQDSKPEEVNDKKKKYKMNHVVPEETIINSMTFSQSQSNLIKTNPQKNSMQVQEVISLPPQTSSSTTSHTRDMLKSAILQSQYTDESISRTRQNNESVDSFEVFSSSSATHTDLKDKILKRQAFNNETPDSSSMDQPDFPMPSPQFFTKDHRHCRKFRPSNLPLSDDPFIYNDHEMIDDDLFNIDEDGYDFYVDGCRSLPDNITITGTTVRVYNKTGEPFSEKIISCCGLSDVIYEPTLRCLVEIRPPHIDPTATVIIRIDTVNRITKQTEIVGYSVFPVFHLPKSKEQPDENDNRIVLNIGCYQIPLYQKSPSDEILRGNSLDKTDRVPCSTVLIRILKAEKKNGTFYNFLDRQNSDDKNGFVLPEPYGSGCYNSVKCFPTNSEKKLYESRKRNRKRILVKNIINRILRHDFIDEESAASAILNLLSDKPNNYISYNEYVVYNQECGFSISIESINGISKIKGNKVYKVMFSLFPPGEFYANPSNTTNIDFTKRIDWDCTSKAIFFKDQFHSYINIPYNSTSLVICQVYCESFTGKINEFGWCICPIFMNGKEYVRNGRYQLPLYKGKFQSQLLNKLKLENYQTVLDNECQGLFSNISLLKPYSLCLKIYDNQIFDCMNKNNNLIPDLSLIPEGMRSYYKSNYVNYNNTDESLKSLLPKGKNEDEIEMIMNNSMIKYLKMEVAV